MAQKMYGLTSVSANRATIVLAARSFCAGVVTTGLTGWLPLGNAMDPVMKATTVQKALFLLQKSCVAVRIVFVLPIAVNLVSFQMATTAQVA